MTDWQKYWNTHPLIVPVDAPLKQVGKTVNGIAITTAQVEALVADILAHLTISRDDKVLDLCCGNGVITHRSAAHCRSILGVDYSEPLIQVARASYGGDNISYSTGDVRDLSRSITSVTFDKIYMYEALQHLDPLGVRNMLQTLRQSASPNAPLLLASVPDEERIWLYYNTPTRRDEYLRRKTEGNEAMGHWWTKAALASIAKESGYQAEFLGQNPILHTAHYRFDVLLRPKN